MSKELRITEPVRWSMNEDAYSWFSGLSDRLHTNTSVLMRMFILQLKERDPTTLGLVMEFVQIGLSEPLLRPRTAKIFVEKELKTWLQTFVGDLVHPCYPKRRVWLRHLLSGYIRYLEQNADTCVRYGAVRLDVPSPPPG